MAQTLRPRVLVIGVGSIGERHLRCFQNTQRVETAIVEINPDLRQTIATRYNVPYAWESLEQALEQSRQTPSLLAAAIVCTPAPFHVPQATALLQAGLPVLIEKPLSTGTAGLAELISLAESRPQQVGVAYVYRSHHVLQAMRDKVLSGDFGQPVQLIAVCGQHFPTYRPAYREIYYKAHMTGGGAIQDALTHVVNAGEWLLGPIDRLVADASHQVLEGVTVEDTVHLIARHGNVLASYSLNQHQAPNETTITVVCERGTVRFEAHENRWRWMERPGDTWHDEPGGPLERDTLFVRQAHRFLDAIEGKTTFPCSLHEGLQTLKVNLAALASLDGSGWKKIPDQQ